MNFYTENLTLKKNTISVQTGNFIKTKT